MPEGLSGCGKSNCVTAQVSVATARQLGFLVSGIASVVWNCDS